VVICLERGADLHTAQLMPLPLTVSCFSKIQIGFTFLVPAHPGRQRAVKWVCVCVWFEATFSDEGRTVTVASHPFVTCPVLDPQMKRIAGTARPQQPSLDDVAEADPLPTK